MSTEKRPLKVFLSYASQDRPVVREIYDALKREDWIDPWLDQEKILPGQNWRLVIETAVDEADVVIICLSHQSVTKEGYVQREIKYAYEIALEKPDGTIFLIPLRLDDCEIPRELRFLQRVDYFGVEKTAAYSDLLDALRVRYDQKFGIVSSYRKQQIKDGSDSVGDEFEPKPVHHPERKETGPREKVGQEPRKIDSTILAALIGGVITIIAALIPFFINQFSSPPTSTPTIPITFVSTPTDTPVITATATPNTPTLTPIPATDTALPTPTGVPPVELAMDWPEGCISTLWKPYPAEIPVTERGDGCWHEPVHVFVAENGDLDFLAEDRKEEIEIHGLFAPLPERGTVNVTVRLNELTNVDVWLGIFAEPNVNSHGLLMTIPTGDAKERVIVQKDSRTNETITGTRLLEQGQGFSISFTFTANSAQSTVNPSVFVTDEVSIPSSQKWLFLGYKSLIGYYRIEGRFLEFELE
jgi:hypothetical protein